ncbi:hypothetical protein [Lacinutrix salivirga]
MRFLAFLFIFSFTFASAQQQTAADVVLAKETIEVEAVKTPTVTTEVIVVPVLSKKTVTFRFNSLQEFSTEYLAKKRQAKVYYIKKKAASKLC